MNEIVLYNQMQIQPALNPNPEEFYNLCALRELVKAQKTLIETLEARCRNQERIIWERSFR